MRDLRYKICACVDDSIFQFAEINSSRHFRPNVSSSDPRCICNATNASNIYLNELSAVITRDILIVSNSQIR